MSAVPRRTLTDEVSDALMKLIIDDDMAAGDAIPSAGVLAKRFDVSSVVVREAVAQLAGRGVLSRRQGREAVVTLPGADILAEILSVHGRQERIPQQDFLVCRAALELESATLAASQGTEASRSAALVPALDALRAAAQTTTNVTSADLDLHLAIADLSENGALKVILTSLVDVITTEISSRTHGEDEGSRVASVRSHEQVVAAIIAGDPAAARRAMAEHFEAAIPGFANRA